jgi:nucleotide-binding universal stress UspA family protein
MALKDVLLQVSSYPEPTPAAAIEQAVIFAQTLGANISALTFNIEIPRVSNVLANTLLDIPGMIAAERQKSVANARNLTGMIESMATERGVPHEQIIESCTTSEVAAIVTEHARMHDVTMIPVGEEVGLQQYVAECVIFGSGRPTIVLPEGPKRIGPLSLDVIGVAWDFSRPAARAVADAMPILERAKAVRVVTITQEKTIVTKRSGAELIKHFACHGIEVGLEEEEAAGRTVGQALEEYAAAHKIDLLVMGAYGHSRLRDFILGGATKTVITHPKLPVLLSH